MPLRSTPSGQTLSVLWNISHRCNQLSQSSSEPGDVRVREQNYQSAQRLAGGQEATEPSGPTASEPKTVPSQPDGCHPDLSR